MRKTVKIWLIIAIVLVVFGGVFFTVLLASNGWDLEKGNVQTKTYEVSEEFGGISIDVTTEDITFLPAKNGKCQIVTEEREKTSHQVCVENGVLTVRYLDKRQWYDRLFGFGKIKTVVYLPKTEYLALNMEVTTGDLFVSKDFQFESANIGLTTGDVQFYASVLQTLKMEITTGDIVLKNVSAGAVTLSSTTGDINISSLTCKGDLNIGLTTGDAELTNVSCGNLISNGTTGDLCLTDVVATQKFILTRDTGDVTFDSCDANEITVDTSTGDVQGSFLSEKVFIIETNTGKKQVPETVRGGKCKITTSTGDVIITLK